jgi:hypothetical protein
MAQDQKKVTTGGNKPKPANNRRRGSSGQSAKDKSKAASRPVSGKAPSGKGAKASGAGGAPRAATPPVPW